MSIDASLRDFYEKKIQKLQLHNIQLQEQLYTRPTDQYKLKYDLLLERLAQENQLRQSKRHDQVKNYQKTLIEVNNKWENVLQEKINEQRTNVEQLQNQNRSLSIKNTQLQLKTVRLQREIDEGDSEVLKLKFDGIRKENERLRKQNIQAYALCDKQLAQAKIQADVKFEELKQRERICYRAQIQNLQLKISQLQKQLQAAKALASPQREANLSQMQSQLVKQKENLTQQYTKLANILEKRNKQIKSLKQEDQRKDEVHVATLRQLRDQLKKYQERIFKSNLQKEAQLTHLHNQLEQKRKKQADELKNQIRRTQQGFERERSEWKHIIAQFETENGKIKKDWEEEKLKYIQEKKRLKDKISELRARLKQKDEGEGKGQTQNLLNSLRELNSNEDQFNSYENAITFMDRQVRKAGIKNKQKDNQINSLLGELKNLQEQSQKEIFQTRQKAREQQRALYDKIFALEDLCDRLQSQLKEKQKSIRKNLQQMEVEKEGHKIELENLKKIMEEMQRDYKRLTSNKKNLQDSYRQERQNVITGKVDVNQQRKKKWIDLARQKNELQLVFRERQNQLRNNQQIQLDKLKREKHQAIKEKQSLRAEVELLKERLGQKKSSDKQLDYTDYNTKLATLDLEIALTQNLFKSLTKATARGSPRQKTELAEMSQRESQHLSSSHNHSFQGGLQNGQVTPQYQSLQFSGGKDETYRGAAFSFFPPPSLN